MKIKQFIPLFASATFAGGLMHNTNQSTDFVRNFAQDASTTTSAVYYNPAGTAFMDDGLYVSAHSQTVWQTREIDTDKLGDYEGKSFVPVMPSLLVNWHRGNFALSGGFYIIGGGGEAKFDKGLPLIDALLSQTIQKTAEQMPALGQLMSAYKIQSPTQLYEAKFIGKQYVYAWQLGASYRFMDMFSAFLGARLNYAYNSYSGSMKSLVQNEQLDAMLNKTLLDCEQTGWGITPMASLGFHYGKFSAGVKYEHNTYIEMKNETDKIEDIVTTYMPQFIDGKKSDNDLPGFLAIGLNYAWTERFRTGIGYHHYFDTFANYPQDRQNDLDGDENEFVLGVEADILKPLTVSASVQRTMYGITDDYISDLSFVTDSWSVGGGIAFRFTDNLQVQIGYMETLYEERTKTENGIKKTYDRTSHNVAAGIDFKI